MATLDDNCHVCSPCLRDEDVEVLSSFSINIHTLILGIFYATFWGDKENVEVFFFFYQYPYINFEDILCNILGCNGCVLDR